ASARPVRPEVVARWQLNRQVHESQFFVNRNLSPHACVAGVGPRILLPGIESELAGPRDRVEDPQPFARPYIEPANVTLHIALAFGYAAGFVRGAHDDDVSGYDRRRMKPYLAGDEIDFLIIVELQIHYT